MPGTPLRDLAADLKVNLTFFTRLPLGPGPATDGAALARALWAAPLAGLLIGALGAVTYGLAYRLDMPPLAAATLAIAATMAVTGALHEDGLADTADGFGGGASRERKLDIMHDSRIGTFGVCALIVSVLLRVSALASLLQPAVVAWVLIASHAAARGVLPAFMGFVPPARNDGLSAGAGQLPERSVIVAGLIAVAALFLGLGLWLGLVALLLVLAALFAMAWLCRRQIGGQTGDVLGALEQVCECLILLVASAMAVVR